MEKTMGLESFRERFTGELVMPGEPGYEDSRRVFNAMIDRRPAVIARCYRTEDVAMAVDYGRRSGLPVAVRSGGHSVAGLSVCDGGILIDLVGLKKIEVDPEKKTARAGGGVLWSEFDAETQKHALHTPGGRFPTTGIGGFTLGGGYGWTSSKYGLTCDNLMSATVVLADGSIVTAGTRQNADLFWGIRGGGGNFGIVTEFEFALHELGPLVFAGLALWPMDRAREVMGGWRDYADSAPDEFSSVFAIITAPPADFVPDHLKGRPAVAIPAMYVGDAGAGANAIKPIRDLKPDVDLFQQMPYTAFQSMLDPTLPPGNRSYWRGEYMNGFPDKAIDAFLEYAPALTAAGAPFSQILIIRLGQGVTTVADDAAAFSHRDANYLFHPISVWSDAADDESLIAANRKFAEAMRPFGTGAAYLNFTMAGDRVRDAYGSKKYERLVAIKDKYDPDNLFRMNQNIRPSRQSGTGAHAS